MFGSLINRTEENIAICLRLVLPSIVVILGLPFCMTAPALVPSTFSSSNKITIAIALVSFSAFKLWAREWLEAMTDIISSSSEALGMLQKRRVDLAPLNKIKPEAVRAAR